MLSIFSFVSGYVIRILSFCGWLILIHLCVITVSFEKCERSYVWLILSGVKIS